VSLKGRAMRCNNAVLVSRIFRNLIAAVVLWSSICGVWAAQSAGTIKTMVGSAVVTRKASTLTLVPGERVFPGDRVSASAGSYVGITLHDETRLAIGPGSEMLIREFEFNPSSYVGGLAISFLKGTARVITGTIAKHSPDRVTFNTPTATIGIRGTDFIVDLEVQE
jgi:hypothetical protein